MSPYENVYVGNSFDEIVFTNRNREYGAFVLRKKQKKFLIIGFFIAFFAVTSSVVAPLIYNYYNKGKGPRINDILLTGVEMDTTILITPPEPPKIDLEPMANRFVPPTVVDSVENNEPNAIFSMDDIIASTGISEPPTSIVVPTVVDQVIDVVERPFVTVEIPATFNGGDINEFNKWVFQNLKYPQIAQENGISGKVTVQFVVNAKGNVEDVKVLRGADPALDDEAIRVIKSSPKWTPPIQGGKTVKQLFSLPVNFKMQQ